jgi:hypothetical protein
MSGPEHKRAAKTETGWFVGMQWPMALVLRKTDMKVVSVSRKKIRVHEGIYALSPHSAPRADRLVFLQEAGAAMDDDGLAEAAADKAEGQDLQLPRAIRSVKALREFTFEHPTVYEPSVAIDKVASSGPASDKLHARDQGESSIEHVPEHALIDDDLVLAELVRLKKMVDATKDLDLRAAVIEKVIMADAKANKVRRGVGQEIERNHLKKGLKRKSRSEVTAGNIVKSKRARTAAGNSGAASSDDNEASVDEGLDDAEVSMDEESMEDEDEQEAASVKRSKAEPLYKLPLGSRVAIDPKQFDGNEPGSYSWGKPSVIYGTLTKKGKAGVMHVRWDIDGKLAKSHWKHLEAVVGREKNTAETIMASIVRGAALQYESSDKKLPWPKNFFDALLRSDWRRWVEATQKEMHGWDENAAYEECSSSEMEAGAALIPLGELYSIKRDGRYKFRQIAYGNMLKAGRDYKDTFATTVSADGLRWFYSLACACGKEPRGWDATTGYLQSKQRIPVYAFKPTHMLTTRHVRWKS